MSKSEYIHKTHNVSVMIYHFVVPAKYRRVVFSNEVDETLKAICLEISKRYPIYFLEIGTDKRHVHFLLLSVPRYSATQIVTIMNSITAREIFKKHPEVKKQLWGGKLWTSGFYANTVGQYANEEVIRKNVESQGKQKEYKKVHDGQLMLF